MYKDGLATGCWCFLLPVSINVLLTPLIIAPTPLTRSDGETTDGDAVHANTLLSMSIAILYDWLFHPSYLTSGEVTSTTTQRNQPCRTANRTQARTSAPTCYYVTHVSANKLIPHSKSECNAHTLLDTYTHADTQKTLNYFQPERRSTTVNTSNNTTHHGGKT